MSIELHDFRRWLLSKSGIAIVIALLVLATTGICIFFTPRYEITYTARGSTLPLQTAPELHNYVLELGNTGWKSQEHVSVRLSTQAVARMLVPVSVRHFGVVERDHTTRVEGNATIYDLGPFEPGRRASVFITMSYAADEEPLAWDEIFLGAEATRGKIQEGNPGMTTLGRVMFTLFTDILP